MIMNVKVFSTTPSKKDYFWQIVLLPTITILKSQDPFDRYTVVNIEYLFWSVSIFLNDKATLPSY
jgi:hypothetical protein